MEGRVARVCDIMRSTGVPGRECGCPSCLPSNAACRLIAVVFITFHLFIVIFFTTIFHYLMPSTALTFIPILSITALVG